MPKTSLEPMRAKVRGGTLSVGSDESAATLLTVGPEPRVIGRHAGCHLVVNDRKVSATHLEAVATDRGVRVRDLGSTNGTYIDELEIRDVVLTKPTTLRCGDTRLEFEPNRPERVPLAKSDRFGLLVGGSLAMRALFEQLRSIAPTTLSVLIHGETGTGKELVAQAIHGASRRAGGPLVVIDCAAIPTQLVESKLFGHEKGAFTGALSKHISPFVEASGGTVFLDEIGELPLDVQPKLLRALAAQRVQSVGSNSYVPIDVRVVAATHRDLPQDINRGTFRSDLFFRVAEARVEVPALRDRKEDIPALVAHLLTEAGEEKAIRRIDPLSLDRLMQHDWPGNVRELRSAVKRALAFDKGGPLDVAAGLVPSIEGGPAGGGRASSAIDGQTHAQWMNEHDRTYFAALFRESAGNISEMSRRSGLDRATVRSRVQKHRLGTALPHGR